MRNFSTYKKSFASTGISSKESILYKTIMCPLKDKCPSMIKSRWPTTNIKSFT